VSHSTKRARRTVHRQSLLYRLLFRALGTDFAECQAVLDKEKPSSRRRGDGDVIFAECHSTKDPSAGPFVRFFVECCVGHSTKPASLPSAMSTALGKEPILVPRCWFFAEYYDTDTWQTTSLPSGTLGKVTSTHLFKFVFLFHPNKQKILHRYHIYTSHISHIYITDIITDINIQHKH
jgi:hypothetical protein